MICLANMGTIEPLKFTILLYIFTAMLEHTISHNISYSNTDISPFTEISVTNKNVYIGGAGGIVSLSLETSSYNVISNHSGVWLLLYRDDMKDIVHCYNKDNVSHCTKRDQQFPADGRYNVSVNITYLPVYSMINMKCIDTDFVIIGDMSNGILSLNLTDMKLSVLHPLIADTYAVFKSSFIYNASYLYFFYQIFETSGQYNSSKIGKLCLNYIAGETDSKLYSAFETMKLSCVYEEKTFTKIEHGISFDEGFLVVFREDSITIICLFDQTDIIKRYRDSRHQCRSNHEIGTQNNENCNGQADEFCNRSYSHTCEAAKGIKNYYPVYAGDDVITSVDILFHNGMSIPYVGTNDGRIGQIRPNGFGADNTTCIKNAVFKQIDTTKIIQIDTTQEHILALSSQMFQKIVFASCSSYYHCESCMESMNPSCGWDYRNTQCIKNQSKLWSWIPSITDFCVKLFDLDQHIRIENNHGINQVNFTLKIPYKMNQTCKLFCKVANSTGCMTRNKGPCRIKLQDLISENYNFSIFCQDVVIAKTIVKVFRCEDLLSCTECTSFECYWKLDTFSCYRNGGGDIIVQDKNKCPRIEKNNKLLLHANVLGNITIHIEEFNFIYFSDTSAQYKIKLKYKTFYVDSYAPLKVYSCRELLHDNTNCGECQLWINNNYDCQWCTSDPKCYHKDFETCNKTHTFPKCIPSIKMVNPSSGPMAGGTLITITGHSIGNHDNDDIIIDIDGAKCNHVIILKASNRLTCVTGQKGQIAEKGIIISVNGTVSNTTASLYEYKEPEVMGFSPNQGILSGKTTVIITGKHIGFQGPNRYFISFCDDKTCIGCSVLRKFYINDSYIKCSTGNSTIRRNMTKLEVVIDDLTNLTLDRRFEYIPDPSFKCLNETPKSLQSGGASFTINGEGFNSVGAVTVERVQKSCDVKHDTKTVCQTPKRQQNQSDVQPVFVHFDGLSITVEIEYVDDPHFTQFQSVLEYDKESSIQINGRNILNGAKFDDFSIHIGLDGKCTITYITMLSITCLPPTFTPRTNDTDENTVFVIVEVANMKAYIGKIRYKEDTDILAIMVGLLAAALFTAVVVGILIVLIMKKKKKKIIKEFKMELLTREEMIRKASREEFADAQMTMREIKSDLVTSSVPFRDYQTYVLYQLFPMQDLETNPLLHDSKVADNNEPKVKAAFEKFELLLTNKLFLKTLVQTLDRKNMLTMQEKAHFSAVLSIALLGDMRLLFELINCLLSDMIHASTKKQHRVLFRRFDSITSRLMANWLHIGLYKQLTTHNGMHLFMLYKAVQTIIEMSPIDALTGNAKNTIAEEKLLKMRIEHQPLTLQIDLNGNSDEHYPVRVLDCDTISQVKQKCCAQIYKNKPASERPRIDELTLEWQEGSAGKLILDDIDNISETGNVLVRLNTLKHYMVKDNCKMALMYNHHDDQEVYVNSATFRTESMASEDITLLMSDRNEQENVEIKKWHLETFSSNLPDDEKSNREADFGDIFLNRLFHTKLLLSDYVDSTFEGLLDPQTASISIRYFLWMLDKLGQDAGVEDDVLQSWKTECYATRVWAPLIGKPDILFDVMDTDHVEPCMDILRQVFVESCTQSTHKISKESSTQKLLFHKDIPRYRKLIGAFFIKLEPVSDHDFLSEMDECSNQQKAELTFSRQATLHQLYNLFIGNYKNEIMEDFEDMEESKDLQFASKLQEIIELMNESSI